MNFEDYIELVEYVREKHKGKIKYIDNCVHVESGEIFVIEFRLAKTYQFHRMCYSKDVFKKVIYNWLNCEDINNFNHDCYRVIS